MDLKSTDGLLQPAEVDVYSQKSYTSLECVVVTTIKMRAEYARPKYKTTHTFYEPTGKPRDRVESSNCFVHWACIGKLGHMTKHLVLA